MKLGKYLLLCALLSETCLSAHPVLWPPCLNRAEESTGSTPLKKEKLPQKILIPEIKSIYVVDRISSVTKLRATDRGIFFSSFPVPGGDEGLRDVLAAYLYRPLTADDLLDLKRAVILYYRDNNHPLVSVQIPEQDVTDGKFTLIVRESVLGKIQVYGINTSPKSGTRMRSGSKRETRSMSTNCLTTSIF